MFPDHAQHLKECTVRPLFLGEAAELGQVLSGIDPWGRLGFAPSVLTAYLDKQESALTVYAIEVAGVLAGAVALRQPWLRGPYLELMAIVPTHQKRGLGRMVLDWAMDTAKASGAGNFWACVSAFNDPARAFYRRLGFVEVTSLDDLVQDGEAEILLRKRLY